MNSPRTVPHALMLLTPDCPHCPAVLQALAQLVKEGALARLDVVNIAVEPEEARRRNVRSVPWVRIGEFELGGTRSPAELRRWAANVGTPDGRRDYLAELLRHGGLATVVQRVQSDDAEFDALLALVPEVDAEFQVRVGVGAALEHLQGSALLRERVPLLAALTRHADARVRADAAHYLALTDSPGAIPHLEPLLRDADAQVREIAAESLEHLRALEQ